MTKYFNVCSAARPTNDELTNTINQTRSVTVTELINKLTSREGWVNKAKKFLTIRKNHDDYLSTELGFSTIVPHQDGQTAENVSSVIGLIVVAYCAWKKTGNLKQLDIFRQNPNTYFNFIIKYINSNVSRFSNFITQFPLKIKQIEIQ